LRNQRVEFRVDVSQVKPSHGLGKGLLEKQLTNLFEFGCDTCLKIRGG
jgi:hypothetical protein